MTKPKTHIAILGATSHIGKGLIDNFSKSKEFELNLFTRSKDKLLNFVNSLNNGINNYKIFEGYESFNEMQYDCIINCVGVGTVNKLEGEYHRWFTVTEEFDNKCINYVRNNPETLYISISSGMVYGNDFAQPFAEDSIRKLNVNEIKFQDYYSIARLNAEVKHRSFEQLKIVDLRIFNYFSRYIDLTDNYFITDIINSIKNKNVLKTNEINIVRDYVSSNDLFDAILLCIDKKNLNCAFDITSLAPVSKEEILEAFVEKFDLQYEKVSDEKIKSGTGSKNIYYSINRNSKELGYEPVLTSIENLVNETKHILQA